MSTTCPQERETVLHEPEPYACVLPGEMRERRMQVGITQVAMSRQLGLSGPSVNRWEKGRELPSFTRLVQAAIQVYGVDPEQLLLRLQESCAPDPRVEELGISPHQKLLRAALEHQFGMPGKRNGG